MNEREFVGLITDIITVLTEHRDRLESIELKNQCRAPELKAQGWMELAALVQSMPVEQIAALLAMKSERLQFSDGERSEIQRALSKSRTHILEVALPSKKINDADRAVFAQWLEDNESASEKLAPD